MRFAVRLKQLRDAAGLTQEALAVEIGVSQSHVCKLERGQAELGPELLTQLARALNVNERMIVGGTELEDMVSPRTLACSGSRTVSRSAG